MQFIRVENQSNPNVKITSFDAESGADLLDGPFLIGGVLKVESYEVVTFLDLITDAKDHVEGFTDESDSKLNDEIPVVREITGNVDGLLYIAETI